MDFVATKRAGKLMMSTEMGEMRDAYINNFPDGTQVRISIKRIGRNKSVQQVRCHWGLVIGMIRMEFDDRGIDLRTFLKSERVPPGIPVPADVIQSYLYACCNDVGDDGERKTLSKMNTVEASRFFEKCRNHAASEWSVAIPEPDPNWRMQMK